MTDERKLRPGADRRGRSMGVRAVSIIRAIPRKDDAAVARVKDWLESQPGYWLGHALADRLFCKQTQNKAEQEWLLQREVRHMKRAEQAGGYRLAHEGDAA